MNLLPNLSFTYICLKEQDIANKSLHINALKKHFDEGQKITVSDIIEFYAQFEEKVKRSTIDWRLYKLTQEGILYRQSRGIYSLSEKRKKTYTPEITRSLKILAGKIHKQFPYIDTCLWTTKWLNEFMLHQPGRFLHYIGGGAGCYRIGILRFK